MKKYFYSVFALATMLFAASSCSQDEELVSVGKGDVQNVSFSVKLPGSMATRAIADGVEVGKGNMADKLLVSLYEEDTDEILISKFIDEREDGLFEFNVPMAKDVKYDILFLAYNPDNCAFVINADDAKANNLKALTLKSELKANQESYDAFVGKLDSHGVDTDAVTVVELSRPFAQVNAATTKADMDDAKTLKAEVATAEMVIKNVPNTLNIFTGEVSGNADITFEAGDVLTKTGNNAYPNNETITVEGETYYYLSMSYVLAGEAKSIHDTEFAFIREDGKQVSSLAVANLPVQRNYRTNVVGSLITKIEGYQVKIDAAFNEGEINEDEVITVSTADELRAAINGANAKDNSEQTVIILKAGTYTGAFDINGKNVALISNENAVIDGLIHGLDFSKVTLRGLTLTNATPAASASARHNADYYCLGAYVTSFVIENCTFNVSNQGNAAGKGAINIYANRDDYAISEINGERYDLVIKNCTFNCNGERSIRGKTNSYIENCTFNEQHRYAIQVQGNSGLSNEVVTFKNNKIVNPCATSGEPFAAAVSISGSQFIEDVTFHISGNTLESDKFTTLYNVYDNVANVKTETFKGGATFVPGDNLIATQAAFAKAMAAGGDILLGKGTYTWVTAGKSFNLVGAEEGVNIVMPNVYNTRLSATGIDVYFKNVTLKYGTAEYTGMHESASETYENCVIEGYVKTYAPKVAFKACTFNQSIDDAYSLNIYGKGETTISNCNFNGTGKGMFVYNEGAGEYKVKIENTAFKASKTVDGKAAIQMHTEYGIYGTLTLNNVTATGFDSSINGGLYNELNNSTKVPTNNFTKIIDGKLNVTVDNEEDFEEAFETAGSAGAGHTTIYITKDLDYTGTTWEPIYINGYQGADIVTIEGNDHTIKGLTASLVKGGFAGGSGLVVKNLTIDASSIVANNTQGYGAFIGCADSMDEITLINCHLKNSSIITPNDGVAESRVGGLIGWTAGYNNQNDGPVDSYITVKNCSVIGCTFKAWGSIGGIIGHAGANAATFTIIEDCIVKDNTITSTDDGGWRVGVVVGTANNGQCEIKNITESGNTLSQENASDVKNPTGEKRNYYGRFVPSGTGSLVIDGTTIL